MTIKDDNILVIETKRVPVKDLNVFYKNPRVGNVDLIATSLEENGQYKPILVNIGTKTGRPNEILGGNHTYLAARHELTYKTKPRKGGKPVVVTKKPWTHILASFVDVDDERALAIVLVDNKSAEEGTYDEQTLADLFRMVDDLTATGFDTDEVDDILARFAEEGAAIADEAIADFRGVMDEAEEEQERDAARRTFLGSDLGDEPEDEPLTNEQRRAGGGDDRSIEKANDTLPGAFQLSDEIPEDYIGYWQIPKIRTDALVSMDDLPDNLESWGGSATKDWPVEDQWWLYNWGVDSTSGMKDVSKVILGFYTWDDYFDNWYWFPSKFVTKALNSKITMAINPNYSLWSAQPQAMNLWALYRSRWVARYFQEAGINVIIDINWPLGDEDFLKDFVLATLPKKMPMIALQMQTLDKDDWEHGEAAQIEHVQLIFDTLKPQGLLLYAGKPGREWFEANIKPGCPVRVLSTRNEKLSESAKKREKKRGI